MYRSLLIVASIAVLGLVVSSCASGERDNGNSAHPETLADSELSEPSLIGIMQGLEKNLAEVAHGLWVQDSDLVQEAAARIADHPKIPEHQLVAIKAELGSEMPAFAQFDQVVHSAAVELTEAVDLAKMFEIYSRMEQGCFSCHAVYQERVSRVLAQENGSS